MIIDGPDQLWVADLTYVAVVVGFIYVAVIMDARSRRIIGYAMSRRIDARLILAALDPAIALRQPPPGCVHHTDRGSQHAAEKYRERLRQARLVGSIGRSRQSVRQCDMESLMRTLKVKGVYRSNSRPPRTSRNSSRPSLLLHSRSGSLRSSIQPEISIDKPPPSD